MSEYVFKLPDLGEGTVEAEIAEWMVNVGDLVQEEDPFGAMLTDKAAVELSAPVTGRVVSLAGEPGDVIAVGAPLIVFETEDPIEQGQPPADGVTRSASPAVAEAVPAADIQAVAENRPSQSEQGKVLTSPSIRRRAREAGADLTRISGSGPRGRIMRSDLDALLDNDSTAAGGVRAPVEAATEITEIKVVGLRRIIAERMSKANREIPHFTYVEEIDITALETLRQHLNNKQASTEERLSLLPFIGLALVRVLRQFPQCNALYDAERNIISRYQAVHLGIATQTPDGLKVAVVKHSETHGLHELAGEIRRVTSAARDNTAKREDLMGSTITITSLGKAGGIVSTPIINQPELAIIGVNKAVERPVIVDGLSLPGA